VVDAWMPGARCLRARPDGGTLRGGAPRVVWQALGADPRLISASSAAERLIQERRPPHLVWNPLSGEVVQLVPVVRAACALGGPEGLDYRTGGYGAGDGTDGFAGGAAAGPHPANREGRLCVQIGVVAWAWEPFTDGPLHGVAGLLGWLASWGVPSRWPAGRPAPIAAARTGARSRAQWALGGHFGASQVPGWDAAGPGAIDIELLGAPAAAPATCTAIDGPYPARPGWDCRALREGALSHTRRVALERMLDPDIDGDAAPAAVASLADAGQRALSDPVRATDA
jgi:hypothetical protein